MMSQNQEVGKRGETIVARQLIADGFVILAQNVRVGRLGELDIIAQQAGVVHVIEVKARTSAVFGEPELAVHARKQQTMRRVWEAARQMHGRAWGIGLDPTVQFDVAAVTIGLERAELVWYRNIELS